MRSLYDIRRELVKYKQNLREINRLITSNKTSENLLKEKLKIKCKIEKLEEELERKSYDKERNISKD
mgnify:FL=1